ncbi:MAG: hypothetical protein A3F84_10730 [Candidatus Handelsmanbacteria bacterium RIFCSPLOWO2_12_FULL_64_10]|uniref:Uncharacterized protein n=1 Tax=Handelsmanbacteria sp. (strain RIFCSPLOWO2_12_FULL_64_10) TaxID=1817868 RepID=A0A1F6D6A8_HANXR|nr:MAG: hypothetical protein A3F84_10730 [Candidatus Handelsmanbacteria bacterium RIFCSPLOWO2_12_FULL_64_10]
MDERESVSMTVYYGYMHAFAHVFVGEMAMVRGLAARLKGQTPLRAFGWQAALNRARSRATQAAERWALLNERFGEKMSPDPFERRVYGHGPAFVTKAARTAREIVERLGELNRFIDGMQTYDAEGVQRICGVAERMAQEIRAEVQASSLVAAYLERGSPDGARQEGGADGGREQISAYAHTFFRARDAFRARLDG